MTDFNGSKAKGDGSGGADARGDLVSLTDSPSASGEASKQDSILSSVQAFEEQLEQMSAWKHQLAQQMELMRRDGIKLLERQKQLSQEKQRLMEEREALTADRQRVEKLQGEVGAETKALREKEGEIANALGELRKLEAERAKWEAETAAAKVTADELEKKRSAVVSALETSEARLQEIEGIATKRAAEGEALLKEIEAGRRAAAEIEGELARGEAARQGWNQREAELRARETALAGQEAKNLADGVQLREALEQLEEQRKQLVEAQRAVARDKEAAGNAGAEEKLALEALANELSAREGVLSAKGTEVAEREARLGNEKKELEEARATLTEQQEKLTLAERSLAQRVLGVEGDMAGRLAAAESAKVEAELERDGVIKQRRELEKKLDEMEAELSGQLESLAKQTKRLTERRNDLEARATALEKDIEERVARETAGLREELAKSQRAFEERAAVLDQQIDKTEASSGEWKAREAELQASLEAAGTELENAKQEIERLRAQGSGNASHGETEALARQVEMLDQQRNELAAQLFAVQDALKRQTEETLLAKNGMAGELMELRQRNAALLAERAAGGGAVISEDSEEALQSVGAQRERLLRQARNLRAYRKQVQETQATLEQHRLEFAQQREQLRSRKENLEQVKRLLEKQEMVMARKLADHSALKTVAAVGIFVIMILGSVFAGVYKFVNPSFRSEAVVQLAPPPGAEGAELQTWMMHQVEFIKSEDVTFTAWKMLRTPDEHYGMHDVREEWLGSLPKSLVLKLDSATKTVSIQYSGPNAEGVSQVCNALATAYATPTAREGGTEALKSFGNGAAVLAKAAVPMYPVEDNRLMLSLSLVAVVLFVSLIMVIIFRHYVARQLREIDQMADEKDLDDIKGEMAAT